METTNNTELFSKEKGAAYLNVSLSTFNRLIDKGVYQPTKVGKFVKFTKEALDNPRTIVTDQISA